MHYLFVRNLPVLPAEKEFALTFFSGILPFEVERSERQQRYDHKDAEYASEDRISFFIVFVSFDTWFLNETC